MPDYPQEGAVRGGHIPGAQVRAVGPGGQRGRHLQVPRRSSRPSTSASRASTPTTTSSPTAASASGRSHTWFVLTHLLGFDSVRNYDGSWTEWGNAVRVPIEGTMTDRDRRHPCRRRWRRSPRTSPRPPRRRSCSCCWSSATSCPRCPSATPVTTSCSSASTSASPRCSSSSRSPTTGTARCTCSSTPRRSPPRPAGSRGSSTRGWTGFPRPRCSPCPTTRPTGSGSARPCQPLRLRGMVAMLSRIKRQVRIRIAA